MLKLSVSILIALFACASESGAPVAPTCANMCEHLRTVIQSDCGDEDGLEQARCVDACFEKIDEGEADESSLACAIEATNCVDWRDCGDII